MFDLGSQVTGTGFIQSPLHLQTWVEEDSAEQRPEFITKKTSYKG